MDNSTSQPNPQPPVPATIDIPKPPPWSNLGSAGTRLDHGWRQPRYNALLASMPFDPNFASRISDDPRLPFGFHFATASSSVSQLARLADFRQTKFEGKPLKDGSNLSEFRRNPVTNHFEVNGGPDLQRMYYYMKDVLQFLYRNHILELEDCTVPGTGEPGKRFNTYGLRRLTTLLSSDRDTFYQRESTRLDRPNAGPEYALGFEWIGAYKVSVIDGVVGIQAALWWAEEHGFDPIPHMQMAISRVPPITRLILYLLNREQAFNDILGREHVEDILHDKRLNWMSDEGMFVVGGNDALRKVKRLDDMMKPILVNWQKSIRECFDYRMLRDWGYGRHWKKIYLVFDTPPESEERAAIEMFRRWASNNSKLAYEMFGVHPMNKDEIPNGDLCAICYCEWEVTELVLDLHCGHRFHPNCIIRHWDNINLYSNPCANCRTSNGWLKDRMDFEAQKKDIDYSIDDGALARADQHYRYGIAQAINGNWPGGVEAAFRPYDGHHECFWRTKIQEMRTTLREARYAEDPSLADLDGRGK